MRAFLVWQVPGFVAVEQELAAEHQEPQPQCETQRAARNARAQHCSADRADHTAGDELLQQRGITKRRKPMSAAADERDDKPEQNVSTDDLRGWKRRETEDRGG